MKRVFLSAGVTIICISAGAQNVGIGTPTPLQKLEVNGAIKIGTTTTNQAGAIRYNAGRFEGGDGTNWKSLEGLPAGAIVFSKTNPNTALQVNGYSYFGDYSYNYFDQTTITTVAGNWYNTNMNTNSGTSSVPPISENAYLFWNGTEFLLWNQNNFINTGYKYNAGTDQWTKFSTVNAPPIANLPVWTGTELIVWGDGFGFNTPGKYNPSTNVWTAVSTVNAPAFTPDMTATWTGTEMIVFGGTGPGGKYNPLTDTWTTLSTTNAPSSRTTHSAVWTGDELIIWGGLATGSSALLNTGAKYKPSTNTWTTVASTSLSGRVAFTAVWTGTEMVVMGGSDAIFNPAANVLRDGAEYNPATNTWASMVIPAGVYNIKGASAVWTGTEIIYWGGFDHGAPGTPTSTGGARYNPVANTWNVFTESNDIPAGRLYHAAAWNGNLMMVFGGKEGDHPSDGYWLNSGGRYFLTGGSSITVSTEKNQLFLFLKN